ncbi:Transcription factor Dp-2 [Gamsiella multidivaricata]|nr:Transcription factor Dp-2 [Gamsiella multidivaricata]
MSILRQSSSDSYFAESPLDYREPNSLRHTIASTLRGKYDHEEHDMERCSEPEDARKGECEDEDEYEDDSILQGQIKKQKLGAIDLRLSLGTKTMPHSRNTQRSAVEQGADGAGKARAGTNDGGAEGEAGEEGRQSALTSTSSSRKQSMSGSVHGDEAPACKSKKGKVAAQKRGLRRASLPVSSEALDRIEDDAQAETGPQSLAGRGLRIYAQRVCEQVEAKRSTSYNELVHDLFGGNAGENVDELPEAHGQENIRRRVYDALNVLEALDIISFVNKDIHWVGIEQSSVIHEVTESQTAAPALAQGQGPGDGGDDESEEPEDDDMEIEKLQREVDAMRLQNNLEQAKLQDQLTRHVQVLNLVKRNKRREAKDEEREERRRQRKEEKRVRAMMIDQDPTMTDVGPLGASDHNDDTRQKSDRPRRRRIHRHSSGQPEGQVEASGADGMEEEQEGEEEEEEARRRRKQERRERRERKDKRAQRRLEKEQEKVQLPFVVVRMPGYTGQSSDSESSISVMRSVRADQKSRRSDKGKRQGSTGQETTMVEIQIPQQDELSIISDTEILGDLGFNTVSVNELETMLPKSLVDAVQYTVNAEEDLRSSRENSTAAGNGVQAATSITVRGGFEREIVRAASEDASSNA